MKLSTEKAFMPALLLVLLVTCPAKLKSQEVKMKFGDVDISELQMKSYSKDTSAAAVILGDFGNISFTYDQNKGGFKVIYVKQTRIKILKKDGYSWADHSVELYKENKNEQSIGSVSGTTYNLEGGKIKKSKLTKDSQFREKISEYWEAFKFTMPDVKVGSVIEYRYTVTSDYIFTLPVWYFQYSIPVVWSELKLSIPEYYTYNRTMTGYDPLVVNESSTDRVQFTYTQKEKVLQNDYMFRDEMVTSKIDYMTNDFRMAARDVPAFTEEPYLTSAENYTLKATYELAKVWFPGSLARTYTESWETINQKMLEHENFGMQLKSLTIFINDKIDEINASTDDPLKRINAIYEYIKGYMKWNSKNSCFTTSTLRSAFNDKSGNAADINLLLTVMLRKAGFDANPVILSTRSKGIVNVKFPILSQFNYVVASVNHNGSLYFLDATDPNCTIDLLPVRCLNGNGLLVSEKGPKWLDMNTSKRYNYVSSADLILDQTGKIEGSISNVRNDYGAYRLREMLDDKKSEDDFIEQLEKSNPGLEITDFNYINREEIYEPMTEEYKIRINGYADIAGEHIYFNPLVNERIKSNPFKLEERKYPIDFAYPIAESYILNLKIPEGYTVEEIPKKLEVTLPGNSATFAYNIEVGESGDLRLTNEFAINKPVFFYNEYESLKEFYNKIVQKHAEAIVLKKIN